jgi:hypothetical protein
MASQNDSSEPPQTFEREWPEFLTEVRVALPGVQLLFGFLLAAPFATPFDRLSATVRVAYFVCFLTTAASCGFLMAPTVYHRLHWRRDVRDKEQMLRTSNGLAITGIVLLAAAMSTAVFTVAHVVAGLVVALVAGGVAALLFVALWFVLPLTRRSRERSR